MVIGDNVASDRRVEGLPSERPASGVLSRLGIFIFGVMPSDEWQAPIVVWVMLALGAALLLASHAIRHWGWRLGGFEPAALATAASIGSSVLLLLMTVGLAIVRVRRLMAPPR